MGIRTIRYDESDFQAQVAALRETLRGGVVSGGEGAGQADVAGIVRNVIEEVKLDGDEAVLDFTAAFDKVELTADRLAVSAEEISSAYAKAEARFLQLVRRAVANIRQYQERILLKPPAPLNRGGREMGVRYAPVDRVGIYVPGGRAFYPSTVLMTVVPAQVAGVKEIAMVSPPTVNEDVNPMVLALAGELGVTEVYRVGGAQAVAALAIGTRTIRAVDKIVGPGNAYVSEAKRQLFGRVGIDSIAGPSEVLIIADDTADAQCVAADLLAQAEHDPGSALLVTTSRKLADAVAAAIDQQAPRLERKDAILAALGSYSAIVVAGDLEAACGIANEFAAEHLRIITADDDAVLARIRHAGAIFLGPHTPVPLGDYYAGPSHVLPTGGTARFFGPLSCNDFLKASSVVRYDAESLAADAPDVAEFARREGLTAHARAVEIRRKGKSE
jgi:histidinol dehydrogenase